MLSDERAAFEEWCFANGLMAESHGVRSESRACDVAWLAWQARAAVKDVKRSTLLEVIQLLNQSPYSLTKRECIDLVTALKMKVDNNEN